jgi:hypothetical protein
MKNLLITIVALSLGFASCQQENVMPATETPSAANSNLRESMIPNLPKNYRLIKHGDIKLAYGQDGRLEKVTYLSGQRGTSAVYAMYKYGAQKISSTLYEGNKVVQLSTYLLDSKGRCYESTQIDYIPNSPNSYVEKQSSFTYLYDAKGQITTRTNKKAAYATTNFIWNAAGDLTKMTGYNFSNGRAYEPITAQTTLNYDATAGDPMFDNLSKVNLEAANFSDAYLPIFGKQSKHLVRLISEQGYLGGKFFNYVLNADGYTTKRDIYEITGAKLIETSTYDYLVTELSLNL